MYISAREAKISPIFHFDRANNGQICHILSVKESNKKNKLVWHPTLKVVQLTIQDVALQTHKKAFIFFDAFLQIQIKYLVNTGIDIMFYCKFVCNSYKI